jgi:RimJ/RimL family protein N-acetyltransferase
MTAALRPLHSQADALAAAISRLVPRFETARLVLRAPVISDYAAYEPVFIGDRAKYMGGPFTQDEAYADFCQGVAAWMLRGAGMWTMTLKGDEAPLGWIYLWREFGDPEDEIGWVLTEAAEGKGYATEAALAVLPYALSLYGKGGFVSYIDTANDRSARIATRLGARRDLAAEAAMGDETLHIYRHTGEPQ